MPKVKVTETPAAVRTMLSVQATPDRDSITTAELHGQEHTVIPCIALVEGVLWPVNAPAPELALAEEFGRFAQGWNGRPVVFGHPFVDGLAVSASDPDVLEDYAFGQLFNTVVSEGKLKTEIWIDRSRIEDLSEDAQEAINSLSEGDVVAEVSTGLFTQTEQVQGTFEGEDYEAIWRNIVPDHLAVLPLGVAGACSVADGCGAPRTNQLEPVMRAAQLNASCDCGTKDNAAEEKGIFARLLETAGGILNFTNTSEHLSDADLRTALNMALKSFEPDNFFFILAVYPGANDSGTFVYEVGFDGTLFQRSFSVVEGGSIEVSADNVSVRPVTTFVPVEVTTNSEPQENDMNVEELVNDLITNEGSQFGEDDREWLSTLEEDQLSKMTPPAPAPVVDVEAVPVASAAAEEEPAAVPVTTAAYIEDAPAEVREVLESGLRMHRDRKAALVTGLMASARNRFTQEALESKGIDELESITALACDISYEGAAVVSTQQVVDDNAAPPMPKLFSVKSADGS